MASNSALARAPSAGSSKRSAPGEAFVQASLTVTRQESGLWVHPCDISLYDGFAGK